MRNLVVVHFFEPSELFHAYFIVICRVLLVLLRILVFSSFIISEG